MGVCPKLNTRGYKRVSRSHIGMNYSNKLLD